MSLGQYVILIVVLSLLNSCTHGDQKKSQSTEKAQNIDSFLSAIHTNGQFSGALLVSENGKIIYNRGIGYADRTTKEKFTSITPCYVGSLSKQFTAMGVVILKQAGLIRYDQSIRDYFSILPECYQSVSIRNMLQHTSGLALFNDFPEMTEIDVFKILQDQTSLRFNPGSKFEYCNANYSLLGMLIEKVSKKSLDEFLTEKVFLPCGMKDTYVDEPSLRNRKRAVGYYPFGDEYNYNSYIGGAASVVTTVEDLYKWDQMLYHPTIISRQSLEEIFTPGTNTWESTIYGRQGYGFGWFISGDKFNRLFQHDGGFAGFRSYIERQVGKQNSIIFISNVRHGLTNDIREGIVNILNGEPYIIPKKSWANWIMAKAKKTGLKNAILDYRSRSMTKDSTNYYYSENEFNSLGYYLLRGDKSDDAIRLFILNTEQNSASPNAFDSLGEAYMNAGNMELAFKNYSKVLELDPSNSHAQEMLITIKKEL